MTKIIVITIRSSISENPRCINFPLSIYALQEGNKILSISSIKIKQTMINIFRKLLTKISEENM